MFQESLSKDFFVCNFLSYIQVQELISDVIINYTNKKEGG